MGQEKIANLVELSSVCYCSSPCVIFFPELYLVECLDPELILVGAVLVLGLRLPHAGRVLQVL